MCVKESAWKDKLSVITPVGGLMILLTGYCDRVLEDLQWRSLIKRCVLWAWPQVADWLTQWSLNTPFPGLSDLGWITAPSSAGN